MAFPPVLLAGLLLASLRAAGAARPTFEGDPRIEAALSSQDVAQEKAVEDLGGMQDRFGMRILEWDANIVKNVSLRIAEVEASSSSMLEYDQPMDSDIEEEGIEIEEEQQARTTTTSNRISDVLNQFARLDPIDEEEAQQANRYSDYSDVQFVGLSLYTLPENSKGKNGLKAIYTGIHSVVAENGDKHVDTVSDAELRVKLMIDMMKHAAASKYYSRDKKVLKIFMAPEFFFRGPFGAYNMQSMYGCDNPQPKPTDFCNAPIIVILLQLRDEVMKEEWQDWLFVFGTIVSYLPKVGLQAEQYWNFAPIMRGGPKGINKHHIVAKRYISDIDFLQDVQSQQYAVFTPDQRSAMKKMGFTFHKDNMFTVDGIQFGLEVCLDHAEDHLGSMLKKDQNVDVHLVISAGMSIERSHACGPIFLQDGSSQGAASSYMCCGETENTHSAKVFASSPEAREFSLVKPPDAAYSYPFKHSTPSNFDKWWSKKGFATEGSGLFTELFSATPFQNLFATDDYKPKINIGPPFELPKC